MAIIIENEALVIQGDNALGGVRPSVRLCLYSAPSIWTDGRTESDAYEATLSLPAHLSFSIPSQLAEDRQVSLTL